MTRHPVVVVGASAGGIPVLKTLMSRLPPDFPASLCVVLHIAADMPSVLPEILGKAGPLPASHPQSRTVMRPGHIYVAPPDHHLLVDGECVEATKGPKENRFRPSVDALFRSAAYTRGADVIGVVLSGLLDDGTSGLWTIKRRGGTAVVQAPEDAEYDSMPQSALRHVEVDHSLPVSELAALLVRLTGEGQRREGKDDMDDQELHRLKVEVEVARNERAYQRGILALGEVVPLTCPECHGALVQLREGTQLRFRCHTGHAFTADTLLSGITQSSEDKAYELLRLLEETDILLRRLAQHHHALGDPRTAQVFLDKASEPDQRTAQARALALANQRLSEDGLLQTTEHGRAEEKQ